MLFFDEDAASYEGDAGCHVGVVVRRRITVLLVSRDMQSEGSSSGTFPTPLQSLACFIYSSLLRSIARKIRRRLNGNCGTLCCSRCEINNCIIDCGAYFGVSTCPAYPKQ